MINKTGYAMDEIFSELHMSRGVRQVSFLFDLLNKNEIKTDEVDCVSARISYGENRAVMGSAMFEIKAGWRRRIDFFSDKLQPWFILHMPKGGTVEWPLGVFLLESPRYRGPNKTMKIGAYDKTFILEQDRFTRRFFISKGTPLISVIERILSTAGIHFSNIQQNPMVFTADLEYPKGMKKRDAVNEILRMLNYTPIYADEAGRLCAYNFTDPADRRVDLSYASGPGGVIKPELTESMDFSGRANVFTRVALNIDRQELSSTYTNDNPLHPLSTLRRGRSIVDFAEMDYIPDQGALDALTRREAVEGSGAGVSINFQTPLMPGHGCFKLLFLNVPEVLDSPAKFIETAWDMELGRGGTMTHEAKKVVRL